MLFGFAKGSSISATIAFYSFSVCSIAEKFYSFEIK